MIVYLLVGIALAASIVASYTDFKIREVSNTLSFGLIGTMLLLRVAYAFQAQDFSSLWGCLLAGGAFLVLGTIFFYTRQWGGADVKIMTAYGIGFGTLIEGMQPAHVAFWPFAVTLIMNFFLVALVYTLGYAFVMAWKNPKVIKEYRASVKSVEYIVGAALFFSILMLAFTYTMFFWMLSVPVLWFLTKFLKAVEKNCMYKIRKVEALVEFDVPEEDIMVGEKVIVDHKNPNGMTKAQVKKIIKLVGEGKLPKRIKVKWGVPLIPVFPVSLLISLFYGDLLYTLVAGLV